MERLNYATLKNAGYDGYLLERAPERVLQFGEGNFLRAFVDCFIDIANEKCGFDAKVVLCQPIERGLTEMANAQQGLYTLYLRGVEDGKTVNQKRIISAVSRCINPYEDYGALLDCAKNPDLRYLVSNTTEAGIVYDPACRFEDAPPASFPAKLARFLYERYQAFGTQKGKGFVILSCELIDDNGKELQKCVGQYCRQWGLPNEFQEWVEAENLFCSTLVDRIVTGYPRAEAAALNEQNGYEDTLMDTGEVFGFWVIEGPQWLEDELPFRRAGLPVIVAADHTPYKKRKVRILNGAHTCMIPAAFLCGKNIVRECMEDPAIRRFMEKAVHEEIIPTLTLPKEDLESFARAVSDRFANPYIDHALLSIALNCTSKWKARVLPSLKAYVTLKGSLPPCLTLSMAAYIALYRCDHLTEDGGMACKRGDEEYVLRDDRWIFEFFQAHQGDGAQALARAVLSNERMWGGDLTEIPGFADAVGAHLDVIARDGMNAALAGVLR